MISDSEDVAFENSFQLLSSSPRGSNASHSPSKLQEFKLKEPHKKRSKTIKPKKNKIPKLKVLNKLVTVNACESLNDVQEFEYLRDEQLDLDINLKKPGIQLDFKKSKTCKSTNSLAQSVLLNSSPRDLLVVEKPKDVRGVFTKTSRSTKREVFLDQLKNLATLKKQEKISALNNFQNSCKDFSALKTDQKPDFEISWNEKVSKKPCEVDPALIENKEVLKDDEKDDVFELTGKKNDLDSQSLITRYDLKVFNGELNLKRLASDLGNAEKKPKNHSDIRKKSIEVCFDDINDQNYNEEKHIGKINRFRRIKETRKAENIEENQKIDEEILSLLQKPETKIISRTLIGSEALTNFKSTEGSGPKPHTFFKTHQTNSGNKENSLAKPLKKLNKKNLLFLLK